MKTIKFRLKSICYTIMTLSMLGFSNVLLAGDLSDCDFTINRDGSPNTDGLYSYAKVLGCYESVPFIPADRDQIVDVIALFRGLSDLETIYDQRYGWRANLAAIKSTNYPNDFALQNALRAEHRAFKNGHWRYTAPRCYTEMLAAFIPIDFGSTIFNGEQIIFVEDVPFLAAEYAQRTGIDVENLVGKKIVSINGVPALDFFRQFGRDKFSADDNDNVNLTDILNSAAFSIRSSLRHDDVPDQAQVVMVLQSKNNQVSEVTLPWLFAKRSLLGVTQIPLTESQNEFQTLCLAGTLGPVPTLGSNVLEDQIDPKIEKIQMVRKLSKAHKPSSGEYFEVSPDFFEVPEGQLDKKVVEIVPDDPSNDGIATGLQYGRKTTILKLGNTQNWLNEARQTIEYACQNSDNLIIDVRSNAGGTDIGDWLYHHITGDNLTPRELGRLVHRLRNDNLVMNEVFRVGSQGSSLLFYVLYGIPPVPGFCISGAEAGCWLDVATENYIPPLINPFDPNIWNLSPSITETRGGVNISLSREVHISDTAWILQFGLPVPRPTDISSCPGKFEGDNLIILTDGSNASGGYYILEPFSVQNKATIVTMGGFADDPDEAMSVGTRRGGFSQSINGVFAALLNFYAQNLGVVSLLDPNLIGFNRAVDSNIELGGVYRSLEDVLHIDKPIRFDVRLNVWSDSPQTDGYVYKKVLDAVQQ